MRVGAQGNRIVVQLCKQDPKFIRHKVVKDYVAKQSSRKSDGGIRGRGGEIIVYGVNDTVDNPYDQLLLSRGSEFDCFYRDY